MKYWKALAFSFLAFGARGALAASDLAYDVNVNMGSITVIGDDLKKRDYTFAPGAQSGLSISDDGKIMVANGTKLCGTIVGKLASDYHIAARVTERYRYGDVDPKTTKRAKQDAGPPGPATVVVPAGSTVMGNCGGDKSNVLQQIVFQTPKGKRILVQMDADQKVGVEQNTPDGPIEHSQRGD